MAKNKIMIYAYTAHNLGDDLFIENLCTRYPHVDFYLYAPKKYETTFKHLNNLFIFTNDTMLKKLLQRIRPLPKTAIYIGGSLFIEQISWNKQWNIISLARKRHRDFFIIGANFGPHTTETFYYTYETFFTTCKDVCFRDDASYRLFEHLPQVRVANDIVFTSRIKPVRLTTPRIVISVIYPSIRESLVSYDESYFTAIAKLAEQSADAGYEVVLMAFCKIERDDDAIQRIMEKIDPTKKNSIKFFHYETNIKDALSIIETAEIVIATRFHAMILGVLYRKKVFAILYSDKMRTVIEENKMKIGYCDIQNIGTLQPEKLFQYATKANIALETIQTNAEKQFSILDTYIKEKPS